MTLIEHSAWIYPIPVIISQVHKGLRYQLMSGQTRQIEAHAFRDGWRPFYEPHDTIDMARLSTHEPWRRGAWQGVYPGWWMVGWTVHGPWCTVPGPRHALVPAPAPGPGISEI